MAGKVTVGLALHWPCGTDFSGLSTYGLTAKVREMSTPPTLQMEYGPLFYWIPSQPDYAQDTVNLFALPVPLDRALSVNWIDCLGIS